MLLIGKTSVATPVRCSLGYQDSTCTTSIKQAPRQAPTCSTDEGWTTTAAARWIGSGFTQPQCAFQAAPTCPSGFTQTAASNWDGSTWTGLQCQPSVPPAPSASDLLGVCESAATVAFESFAQASAASNGATVDGQLTFNSAGGGGFNFPGAIPQSWATSAGTLALFVPGGTLIATDGYAALYENYPNSGALPSSATNAYVVEAYSLNHYTTAYEPACYINMTTGQTTKLIMNGGMCLSTECNGGGH